MAHKKGKEDEEVIKVVVLISMLPFHNMEMEEVIEEGAIMMIIKIMGTTTQITQEMVIQEIEEEMTMIGEIEGM